MSLPDDPAGSDPRRTLDTTRVHSVSGITVSRTVLVAARPFRTPPDTISDMSPGGGGHVSMPGEVWLSHHGILFLNELPEYRRPVLKVLRQPLHDGRLQTLSCSCQRSSRAGHDGRVRQCFRRPGKP
jgi:predicted ATPase with chaperone activity